ncbi:MAG: radical SAM protein [Candidatus Hodarchaeales archaeon]
MILFKMWRTRPDSSAVWKIPEVVSRFNRYYQLIHKEKVARFLLAKALPVDIELDVELPVLWREHDELAARFRRYIDKHDRSVNAKVVPEPVQPSFLDLKAKIADEILKQCCFCERRCQVNREVGKLGICKVGKEAVISSAFVHPGEETVLRPSGTIFFSGCTFKCVFCQNYSISQEWKDRQSGEIIDGVKRNPQQIALIAGALIKEGARNINWVGGDPTSNLHVILRVLNNLEYNTCQLWNSNFYMSEPAMELLVDVMDFWLPDFKYWNNITAEKNSHIKNYREVMERNLKACFERGSGEMIVRHLVMPGMVESETYPILEWCAKNIPLALVNIMGQYRPEHQVQRYSDKFADINRGITYEELTLARNNAEKLGILWRPVS